MPNTYQALSSSPGLNSICVEVTTADLTPVMLAPPIRLRISESFTVWIWNINLAQKIFCKAASVLIYEATKQKGS